jgi:hypothetical protein
LPAGHRTDQPNVISRAWGFAAAPGEMIRALETLY